MPIDPTTVRKRPQANGFSKPISELDPETATIAECEAALGALFKHHSQYRVPASRQPKLWPTANGGVILAIMGVSGAQAEAPDATKAYDMGRREGLFLGELLATIPVDQRPLDGQQQTISSVHALATAIRTMVTNHHWEIAMPIPTQSASR